ALAIDDDGIELGAAPAPAQGEALRRGGASGCVSLEIDLAKAKNEHDREIAMPVGWDLILSPDLFLWQPSAIPQETEVTVSFTSPSGLWVPTPWMPVPAAGAPAGASARFRIPPSAFEWQAMMTFARTAPEMLPVRGATLTVARLDRPVQASSEGVRRWLREAA